MRYDASRMLPQLATMVASILFGASGVATRYVIDQTTPEILAFPRYAIGAVRGIVLANRPVAPAIIRPPIEKEQFS